LAAPVRQDGPAALSRVALEKSVLPFAPEEVRDWIFRGPGWFIVLSVIVGAMAWTIWKSE